MGHHGNIGGVSIFEQKRSSLNNIMTHESREISFCFFLVEKKLSLIWYWFLKTSSSAFIVHMKAEIPMQAPHLTGTFLLMLLSVRSLGKVSEFCRYWRKLPVTQKPRDSDTPEPGHCSHLWMGLPSLFVLLRTRSLFTQAMTSGDPDSNMYLPNTYIFGNSWDCCVSNNWYNLHNNTVA